MGRRPEWQLLLTEDHKGGTEVFWACFGRGETLRILPLNWIVAGVPKVSHRFDWRAPKVGLLLSLDVSLEDSGSP